MASLGTLKIEFLPIIPRRPSVSVYFIPSVVSGITASDNILSIVIKVLRHCNSYRSTAEGSVVLPLESVVVLINVSTDLSRKIVGCLMAYHLFYSVLPVCHLTCYKAH
jgi:hypothetical protein